MKKMTDRITQKEIEQVLELDDKRTQESWGYHCAFDASNNQAVTNKAFIAAAPLMAKIIRQQQGLLKECAEAMRQCYVLAEHSNSLSMFTQQLLNILDETLSKLQEQLTKG